MNPAKRTPAASKPENNQPVQLLATKLSIQAPRSNIVCRERLTELLREGMQRRLTLITAPAGYGKTTLVQEWLTLLPSSGWPVGCISLDEYDNDLLRFWSYVVAALRRIYPPLQFNLRELWRGHCSDEDCTQLNPLMNEIAKIPHSFSLVLDDYHEIKNDAIHRSMDYLVEHLPANCHLVIVSRTVPPLPLSRLRARGQLAEISALDLCFTLDETQAFFSSVMNLDIPWDQVVSLKEITEGWIAGLKLSALSLQGQRDAKKFIASFSGSYGHILEYLTDEVLNQQDEATKDFLLKTSILDELSAPLCNAILSIKDSQQRLDQLVLANLFIVPLDDQQYWYRYHALFSEMLRERLSQLEPEAATHLHLAACQWLQENGYPEKSVLHALAGGETELAADIVEACALKAIINIDLTTVFGWFNRLPERIMKVRPRLVVYLALTNLMFGKADDFGDLLDPVEVGLQQDRYEHIPQEEKARLQRYIRAVRAAAACTQGEGIGSARQALECLLPEDFFFLGLIEHYLAYAYLAAGKLDLGIQALERACQNALSHQFHKEFVLSQSEKAHFYRMRGQLQAASDAYRWAMKYAGKHILEMDVRIIPQSGLADTLRELNQIQEADRLLAEPTDFILSSWHMPLDWVYSIDVCLAVARNLILHAKFAQAGTCIQRARQLAQVYHFIDYLAEARAVHVELWLAEGNLEQALHWLKQKELEAQNPAVEISPIVQEAMARIYLATQQPDKASLILANLLTTLEGSERGDILLDALILQAQTQWQQKQAALAVETLDRAIEMAEPEGQLRAFIDRGETMKELIVYRLGLFERRAGRAKRDLKKAYLEKLLVQYGHKVDGKKAAQKAGQEKKLILSPLVEPLSERELEVLNLLMKGLSSGEIARELVISVNTAKAHIKSIYQKLDVHSRQEAVDMAISLHLLSGG